MLLPVKHVFQNRQQHKDKDLFNDSSIVTACVNCMPHREIFYLKGQLGLRNNNNNCYLNSLISVFMLLSQYIQLNGHVKM